MQHATHDFMENVTTLLGTELNFRLRARDLDFIHFLSLV